MKRLVFFVLAMSAAASLFAQAEVPEYQFASDGWAFNGPRLYQNNAKFGLAKTNFKVPQNGQMIYEFNATYESGLEDGHGGFGIHLFVDKAHNGASWGAGNSYLLWLNYDENPVSGNIPSGFSAQVYRSRSNSVMELVQSFDLNEYLPYITMDDITKPVPVKIWADGNTGEVRVYDPSDPELNEYFTLQLDVKDTPLGGDWVALRTNGVSLSFGMGL